MELWPPRRTVCFEAPDAAELQSVTPQNHRHAKELPNAGRVLSVAPPFPFVRLSGAVRGIMETSPLPSSLHRSSNENTPG